MASNLRASSVMSVDEFKNIDWETFYDSRKFNKDVNTIFCDMDGVVADFDHFVMAHMGRTFSHNAGPGSDKEMWDFLMTIPRLYFVLPPTMYAAQLWDAIKAVGSKREMLTAIPRRATLPTAEQDKRDWVVHHKDAVFGEDVNVRIGPYSRDKWKHANPGDVLIDDRIDNCIEWIAAGGIAVYHDGDVNRTIKLLQHFTKC